MISRFTRALRALSAVGITMGLALGGMALSQPAHAADPGEVNPNTRGSIHVHKYENPTWANTVANGQTVTVPGGAKPIQGVEFTVHPITSVDLTKPEGWAKVAKMTPQEARRNTTTPIVQTTNQAGETTFSNLAVGAYLVQETNAPRNVSNRVADFIVTIPHPSKLQNGTTSWTYDVHVYPKNTVMPTPLKSVSDSATFSSGQELVWTVKQVIPAFPSGDTLRSITLTDVLPSSLEYISVDAGGISHTSNYSADTRTLRSTVTSTTPGETITWNIRTRVKAPGVIPNTATVTFNHDRGPSTVTSNTVTTPWAAMNVDKISSGGDGRLAGAAFLLYRDAACNAQQVVGVTSDALTTGTNGAFPASVILKEGTYYLKETTPPSGYALPANNCIRFDITAADNGTTGRAKIVQIANNKMAVPALPITGANGELLLGLGGTAIALTGVGLTVLAARKRALA
ncbi:MAG: SpaH/EbpB family LPXTG-anchored major pilin [Actinomycetaceae bacterium]|nr:SpaH/EbpB family LPXTG-anchored major pilin [Actinomycetaceae bacterium]